MLIEWCKTMMTTKKLLATSGAIATLLLTLMKIYSFFSSENGFARDKGVYPTEIVDSGGVRMQDNSRIGGSINQYSADRIGNIDARSNNVQNNINCSPTQGDYSSSLCGDVQVGGDLNITTGK